MKKMLAILLLVCVLLSVTACGSPKKDAAARPTEAASAPATKETGEPTEATQTEPEEPAVTLSFDALPTLSGRSAVSDGAYLYFTVCSDDGSVQRESDGLYRSGLNMEDPVLLARGQCRSLLLDGDTLYFCMEDPSGVGAVCAVDTQGTELRRIVRNVEGADSLGIQDGKLFFVQGGDLCIVDDADGTLLRIAPDYRDVLQACAGPEHGIWFSAEDRNGYRNLFFWSSDQDQPWGVVPIAGNYTEVNGTIYYLIHTPDQPEDGDPRETILAIMKMEGLYGDPTFSGNEGRISGDLYSYGQYLFYLKYVEVGEGSADEALVRRLFCWDTETGVETAVPLDAFDGFDVTLRGITGGTVFFNAYNYYPAAPGAVDYRDCRSCALTGGDGVTLNALADAAAVSMAAQADDIAVQEYMAAREREEQEALMNTPYGPGTSYLYLKAGSSSACYRLVRMDGSTQFMVLLEPGEETTQSFPCGKYVLKVARGETWISDEEAFGPSGHYSTTDAFVFEANASYEISTGTSGDFHGDNQAGFMN